MTEAIGGYRKFNWYIGFIFLGAVKGLKTSAEKSIVVGDTWMDIKAGKAAGCTTCLIEYCGKNGLIEPDPDYRITTLSDLLGIVVNN